MANSTSVHVAQKILHNGGGRREDANKEWLTPCDNEDEWDHSFTRPSSDLHGRARQGESSVSLDNKINSISNLSNRATTSVHSSRMTSNRRCDASLGVRNSYNIGEVRDVMMGEEGEGEREKVVCRERESGEARSDVVSRDPLDALFGEENQMDVGEMGEGVWSGGGFGVEQQISMHREPQHSFSGNIIII